MFKFLVVIMCLFSSTAYSVVNCGTKKTNTSLVDRDIFDSVKVGKYGCSLTRSFIWGDLTGNITTPNKGFDMFGSLVQGHIEIEGGERFLMDESSQAGAVTLKGMSNGRISIDNVYIEDFLSISTSKLDELHILNIKAENAFDLKIVSSSVRRFAEIVSSNLRKVKINKSKFNSLNVSFLTLRDTLPSKRASIWT